MKSRRATPPRNTVEAAFRNSVSTPRKALAASPREAGRHSSAAPRCWLAQRRRRAKLGRAWLWGRPAAPAPPHPVGAQGSGTGQCGLSGPTPEPVPACPALPEWQSPRECVAMFQSWVHPVSLQPQTCQRFPTVRGICPAASTQCSNPRVPVGLRNDTALGPLLNAAALYPSALGFLRARPRTTPARAPCAWGAALLPRAPAPHPRAPPAARSPHSRPGPPAGR